MQNVNELTEKFTLDKIEIRQHAVRRMMGGGLLTCALGLMTFRLLEAPEVILAFLVYAESDMHTDICSPIDIRYDVKIAVDTTNELFIGVHKNSLVDANDTRKYIDANVRFEQFFEAELRAVNFIPFEERNVVDIEPGIGLI